MQPSNPLLLRVDPRRPDGPTIAAAVDALRRGELVLLPTDTVYGIAADPRVPGAVGRLYEAKGRDADKPVPFLVGSLGHIRSRKAELGPSGRRLARRFWPGPLTLVLRTGDTFEGFRIPDHPVTLAVLRAARSALRVTSANRSGDPPARTAEEAVAALGFAAAVALDAGPALRGEPSTVVKIDGDSVVVLREGVLTEREIRGALHERVLLFVCTGNICRSPMAEYLMRRWLGPDAEWHVESAGVSAADGLPASEEAIQVLRELGIALDPHRSRRLTPDLVDPASAIVVMTASHRSAIEASFPQARGKVFLLRSFGASGVDQDIEDPIGASVDTYRRVRDEINAVLPDLAIFLHEDRGSRKRRERAPSS